MNGYSPFPTMNSLKNPQDLPSPMKLKSYESIKEQKSITLVPCKVVKISGSLKSGSQSPWFTGSPMWCDSLLENQGHWK